VHTRPYVEATFGEYFDVLTYLPRGMGGHQDVAVVRRRDD
jgi:hypothetical protein